jgi:hypothetical protein
MHEQFIGRKCELKDAYQRLLSGEQPGNLATIGKPRIGKSSLAKNFITQNIETFHEKGLIPVWINLGTLSEGNHLFLNFIQTALSEINKLEIASKNEVKALIQAGNIILEKKCEKFGWFFDIQEFFTSLRELNIKFLFIIDEFDHARDLFKKDNSAFQKLRELSYQPNCRIYYWIIGRRPIREIENQSGTKISTLEGIFQENFLKEFSKEDFSEYLNTLIRNNIHLKDEQIEKLKYYCGTHPFLLNIFAFYMYNKNQENKIIDIDEVHDDLEPALFDYFESLKRILDEEKTLDKLIQLLFGPNINATKIDLLRFQKYGFLSEKITPNSEEKIITFSDFFKEFLDLISRDLEFWPLWKKTEIKLRDFIDHVMSDKYGSNWCEKCLKSGKTELFDIYNSCIQKQQSEIRHFGNRASQRLLDYTYIDDIFEIILSYYQDFGHILNENKKYWITRRDFLRPIRNVFAHFRDPLSDSQRKIAEQYCNDILLPIKKYFQMLKKN